MSERPDQDRVAERADLLPEELAAGSDDPQAQAEAILRESDQRTEAPEQTRDESSQTPERSDPPRVEPVASEDDVERIALSLPETTAEPWYNTPGYKVRGKGFLRIRSEAEGGLVCFVADEGEKNALLDSDPGVYFSTSHYDGYPVILINIETITVEELTEMITDSWLLKAPKRLVDEFNKNQEERA